MRRRQAIAALALAGFFISLYLGLHAIGLIGELRCGTGSCELVQTSRYAELLGVPVAFYGVLGYAAVFAAALLSIARPGEFRLDLMVAVLASIGFLFTVYLTAIELFVIHAICRWCVASAVVITAIWVLALTLARTPSLRTES
jgi:uncharacterized membrane protein